MWRRAGAAALAFSLIAVLTVLGAGPASAAPELSLTPARGPAGSSVTVTGTGFPPTEVEIRWGSRTGPLLATATGPEFSATVMVPDDAPDSYPVVGVARLGDSVSTTGTPYEVTSPSRPVETTLTTVPLVEPTVPAPPVETTTTTTSVETGRGVSNAPIRGGGVDGGLGVVAGVVEPPAQPSTPAAGGSGPGTSAIGGTTATVPPATAGPAGTVAPVAGLPLFGADAASTVPVAGAALPSGSVPPAADGPSAAAGRNRRALGPTSSSQSSGAVQSPGLLLAGAALGLSGVVLLAIRARRRPAS